jgi:hypothetical protein
VRHSSRAKFWETALRWIFIRPFRCMECQYRFRLLATPSEFRAAR